MSNNPDDYPWWWRDMPVREFCVAHRRLGDRAIIKAVEDCLRCQVAIANYESEFGRRRLTQHEKNKRYGLKL
jgi:hypothetical protein